MVSLRAQASYLSTGDQETERDRAVNTRLASANSQPVGFKSQDVIAAFWGTLGARR